MQKFQFLQDLFVSSRGVSLRSEYWDEVSSRFPKEYLNTVMTDKISILNVPMIYALKREYE